MFIKPIELSSFRTTGKEMFAHIPEKDWKCFYPAHENDMCDWALRSLYINEGPVSLLIDAGFGNFNPQILKEYQVSSFKNVREHLLPEDIFPVTHLLFTHLHLDHCGGLLHQQKPDITNVFSSSRIITGKDHLASALQPTRFEKASFQPETVNEIAHTNRLTLVEKDCFIFPWLEVLVTNGHTTGMLVPVIHHTDYSIAFVSDLIPSYSHLMLDATMEYDINPVLTLAERQEFLKEACENEFILFFQHDLYHECCTLKKEGSKIVPDRLFKAEEIF